MQADANETRIGSSLDILDSPDKKHLALMSGVDKSNKGLFFKGELTYPYQTAKCLRALSNLVGSRFYIPPAMLERILREADPVITTSEQVLRFEGFSSCCSCYGRLDIDANGFTASKLASGTTNVDFQAAMRAALSRVRQHDALKLSIWHDKIELQSDYETMREHKVKMPFRWMKGFAEVQAQQVDGTLAFTLNKGQAIRFFRSLPRQKVRENVWVGKQGNSVRLSSRPLANAIKSKGLERLQLIEDLLPISDELRVYTDENLSFSTWVLRMGALTYSFCISSEPWRGFSGEGKLLESLALEYQKQLVAELNAQLHWQQNISLETFERSFQVNPAKIKVALSILASQGKLGYDIFHKTYFHRVLPFNHLLSDKIYSRLVNARELVRNDAIKIVKQGEPCIAMVLSNHNQHRVELAHEDHKCTCPWYSKYQHTRGPCKHILATLIFQNMSKSPRET